MSPTKQAKRWQWQGTQTWNLGRNQAFPLSRWINIVWFNSRLHHKSDCGLISFRIFHPVHFPWKLEYIMPVFGGLKLAIGSVQRFCLVLVVFSEDLCWWLSSLVFLHVICIYSSSSCHGLLWMQLWMLSYMVISKCLSTIWSGHKLDLGYYVNLGVRNKQTSAWSGLVLLYFSL